MSESGKKDNVYKNMKSVLDHSTNIYIMVLTLKYNTPPTFNITTQNLKKVKISVQGSRDLQQHCNVLT